jgi:RAB protein geranylgeranyltransferase component A
LEFEKVGSIIINESRLSSDQSFFDQSPQAMQQPTKTNKPYSYTPAPASASASVRQMYENMDNRQKNNVYIQPVSNQSDSFNEGYEWALANKVKNASQCKHLSDASLEGCRSFVDVTRYVRQTKSNMNL